MKVHFRIYCQGCRYGTRFALPIGERARDGRRRELRKHCEWARHRYEWEYFIERGGCRLVQRRGFATCDLAWTSAQRSWFKLSAAFDLHAEGAHR